MRRSVLVGLSLLVALVGWGPARAAESDDLAGMVNRSRSDAGIATLGETGDLDAVAQRHAERMASEGRIYHNPNLGNEVRGWRTVGENVGRGSSVPAVHQAFMDSATHRREILDTRFLDLGVGVAHAGETAYVVEVFRQPASASPGPSGLQSASPRPTGLAPAHAPARVARADRPRAVASRRPEPVVTPRPPVAGLPDAPEYLARPVRSAPKALIAATSPVDDPNFTRIASVAVALVAAQAAALLAWSRRPRPAAR
ncbi:MAG: CAP domain-containing protein [Acidimicrobiales bacterium]